MTISVSLILHPTVRDPYGVLTLGLLTDLHTLAAGFRAGWDAHRETSLSACRCASGPARYADLRDFIVSEVDVPYEWACAVALWMTREEGNIDGFFLPFPQWASLQ